MENQISCTPLFKRWVKFLKQKNLYGRYILFMHKANKWNDYMKSSHRQQSLFWTNWAITTSTTIPTVNIYVSSKDIYLSKNDYFKNRYQIRNLQELRGHLYQIGVFVSHEETIFWLRVHDKFRNLEERINPTLPVPKAFKNKGKRKGKVKGVREDNSPWYSNFYEDRKVLWRR